MGIDEKRYFYVMITNVPNVPRDVRGVRDICKIYRDVKVYRDVITL